MLRSNIQSSATRRGDLFSAQRGSTGPPSPIVAHEYRRQVSSDEVEHVRNEYVFAATRVLDQHHQFSESQLLRFLEEEHPEIDPTHRFPLLMGAVAGAQYAAKLHILVWYNRYSLDERARALASDASAVLSCLNLGLYQGACPTFSYAGDSTLESLETTLDMDLSASSRPASTASSAEFQWMDRHLSDPPTPQYGTERHRSPTDRDLARGSLSPGRRRRS